MESLPEKIETAERRIKSQEDTRNQLLELRPIAKILDELKNKDKPKQLGELKRLKAEIGDAERNMTTVEQNCSLRSNISHFFVLAAGSGESFRGR